MTEGPTPGVSRGLRGQECKAAWLSALRIIVIRP